MASCGTKMVNALPHPNVREFLHQNLSQHPSAPSTKCSRSVEVPVRPRARQFPDGPRPGCALLYASAGASVELGSYGMRPASAFRRTSASPVRNVVPERCT
uniref:(northern house mosquito) hypothetical protein n=1 Tax=Culex pipiens TaxID=7175 RepID=A0A8D8J2A4_CULPI